MNRVQHLSAFVLLTALAGLPTGCKSSSDNAAPSRGSSVESGDVKLEVMPSNLVDIVQPTVEITDGRTTTIAGSVQRKPGMALALAGRIDIEFLDTDGQLLDSLPALLTPQKVPLDSGTPCVFHTDYDYIPPKGSTVRLHFVDSETAQREDLSGGVFETGRPGGGGGGPNNALPGQHIGVARSVIGRR